MSKILFVLIAVVLAIGNINAQTPYSTEDRGGSWVAGHWVRSGHHRHWVRGHWTTSVQAREEYKDIAAPIESQVAIGKFVDDHWAWEDGRLVYVFKHFSPVAPEEASFSAAALNARLTEADREEGVIQRSLGEM